MIERQGKAGEFASAVEVEGEAGLIAGEGGGDAAVDEGGDEGCEGGDVEESVPGGQGDDL